MCLILAIQLQRCHDSQNRHDLYRYQFSYDELMAVFSEDMHTRFPVYEDNTDNVIGIINMKDLLVYPKNKPFQSATSCVSLILPMNTKLQQT